MPPGFLSELGSRARSVWCISSALKNWLTAAVGTKDFSHRFLRPRWGLTTAVAESCSVRALCPALETDQYTSRQARQALLTHRRFDGSSTDALLFEFLFRLPAEASSGRSNSVSFSTETPEGSEGESVGSMSAITALQGKSGDLDVRSSRGLNGQRNRLCARCVPVHCTSDSHNASSSCSMHVVAAQATLSE